MVTAVCNRRLKLLSVKDGLKHHMDLSVDVGRVLVEILGYGEWKESTVGRVEAPGGNLFLWPASTGLTARKPWEPCASWGEAGTERVGSIAFDFDYVVRMTQDEAAEPDPLIQALLTSPERTRQV